MRAKITKRTVDASQSRTRDAFIWDTETKGFGLKVTPAGNRVYVVQARLNGRPVRCTIGKHGAPWTPDMAREEAVRKLGQIAAGINPNEARAEARRDLSLAELCDLYFSEGCNRKKRTTLTTERGQIERHIKPLLGKRLKTPFAPDGYLFLTDVDLYTANTEGVFGALMPANHWALVSVRRLREAFYRRKADPIRQRARLSKEILRMTGRMAGLRACQDPKCALVPSGHLLDIDAKEERYCRICEQKFFEGRMQI